MVIKVHPTMVFVFPWMKAAMIHSVVEQHIIKITYGAAVRGVTDVLSPQMNYFLLLHEEEEQKPHTQQAQ